MPPEDLEEAGAGALCPARELLPPRVGQTMERSAPAPHWAVWPLFSRRRLLGYAVVELMGHNGGDYEALRIHLSSALATVLGTVPVS